MVLRPIPSPCHIGGRKFDDENPFGHRIAFQQIYSSAASDDAPTKPGNCRQGTRYMSLIGSGVGYVDIADNVAGHDTFPGQYEQFGQDHQFLVNRRAAATGSSLENE